MSEQQGNPITRNAFEETVRDLYHTKQNDPLNLDLGHLDGYYHHHYSVDDFDRSVLNLSGESRERVIRYELHHMETRQVRIVIDALQGLPSQARVLDAGSGRGGTAFLVNRAFGCRIDGVNLATYQNEFARAEAERHGCADKVRFHERNMNETGFPDASFDATYSNETTMYVDPRETFAEFARILKPGGIYVLISWCANDGVDPEPPEAKAIDEHYKCWTHSRTEYLQALTDAGFFPYQVDDLTKRATPYWELRIESDLATGVEQPFLDGYRRNSLNYLRVISRRR
ncbi:SAM-dependent methyltransferase [Streptomyces sp. NPDC101150]|uniref:SAM-dependent methyltransferase n=1 Tax=Streptomyces sp. NPDC101150 TaxID=3366114 RepID=UPI0038208D1C